MRVVINKFEWKQESRATWVRSLWLAIFKQISKEWEPYGVDFV